MWSFVPLACALLHGPTPWDDLGHGGLCPPMGAHHHVFTVYALDTMLALDAGASKRTVLDAMAQHVLGEGHLVGTFPA